MKFKFLLKTTLLLLFFAPSSLILGQTTINFDDAGKWTAGSVALGSYAIDHVYADGVFSATGGPALRNGIAAQDGFPGALGTYSWRLRDNTAVEWIVTISSGGVSDFSMKIRRWDGTPSPDINLDYSTNGGSSWTTISTINNASLDNTSNWKSFSGTVNSANDNIKIRLKANGTTERIMVDDFTWTGYSSGGNQNPVISNITQSPSQYVQFNQTVSVSADVVDSDGTIEGVELRWGKTADNLSNTISMTSAGESIYSTVSSIPAQYNGTSIFYAVYAEDNDGGTTLSSTQNYLVSPVVYLETFDVDLSECQTYSVSGETKQWVNASGAAQMNGYNSGDTEEDWLIVPVQNLDAQDLLLSFDSWKRYGVTDANNYLKLYYSSNYPGQGDPTQFTWTELTFTQPEAEQVWTPSGTIDLSNITGSSVYIGFKYLYTVGNYVSWSIDNIKFERKTYTVTFNVVDGTMPKGSDPINSAVVNFYSTQKPTNETGEAIYTWVETGDNIPYTVTKSGYHNFNSTLNVANKNLVQQVKMLSTKVAVNVTAYPDANTASISWVGSGAEAYRMRYRVVGTSSFLYLNSTSSPAIINVFPETNYEVTVSSKIDGIWSNYSTPTTFTTIAGSQVVASNITVTGITSSSATINWDGAGADLYRIRYNIAGTTSFQYLNSTSSPKAIPVFPESSYDVSVASMVGGVWLAYTTPVRFETPTGAQASNVTVTNITSSTAQVNWNGSGADRYRIVYRIDGTSTYYYRDTYSSPTLINVLPESRYEVKVASRVGGIWYPYTAPVYFDTPAEPKSSFLFNGDDESNERFTLLNMYPNPSSTVVNIQFRLSEASDFTINVVDIRGSIVKSVSLANQIGVAESTIDVSDLAKGVYIVRISSMEFANSAMLIVQ